MFSFPLLAFHIVFIIGRIAVFKNSVGTTQLFPLIPLFFLIAYEI